MTFFLRFLFCTITRNLRSGPSWVFCNSSTTPHPTRALLHSKREKRFFFNSKFVSVSHSYAYMCHLKCSSSLGKKWKMFSEFFFIPLLKWKWWANKKYCGCLAQRSKKISSSIRFRWVHNSSLGLHNATYFNHNKKYWMEEKFVSDFFSIFLSRTFQHSTVIMSQFSIFISSFLFFWSDQ